MFRDPASCVTKTFFLNWKPSFFLRIYLDFLVPSWNPSSHQSAPQSADALSIGQMRNLPPSLPHPSIHPRDHHLMPMTWRRSGRTAGWDRRLRGLHAAGVRPRRKEAARGQTLCQLIVQRVGRAAGRVACLGAKKGSPRPTLFWHFGKAKRQNEMIQFKLV